MFLESSAQKEVAAPGWPFLAQQTPHLLKLAWRVSSQLSHQGTTSSLPFFSRTQHQVCDIPRSIQQVAELPPSACLPSLQDETLRPETKICQASLFPAVSPAQDQSLGGAPCLCDPTGPG